MMNDCRFMKGCKRLLVIKFIVLFVIKVKSNLKSKEWEELVIDVDFFVWVVRFVIIKL